MLQVDKLKDRTEPVGPTRCLTPSMVKPEFLWAVDLFMVILLSLLQLASAKRPTSETPK